MIEVTPERHKLGVGYYEWENKIKIMNTSRWNLDGKFTPYQRMADGILNETSKRGSYLPQDLPSLGFLLTKISRSVAHAAANVELRLIEVRTNGKRVIVRRQVEAAFA